MESTAAKTTNDILLDVKDLNIRFKTKKGYVNAVEHLDFHVKKGERLALVGESGCGKSVTSLALMKLLPDTAVQRLEKLCIAGMDVTNYSEKQMQPLRGSRISIIFQDALSALNPVMTVGKLIDVVFR